MRISLEQTVGPTSWSEIAEKWSRPLAGTGETVARDLRYHWL